MSNAVAILETLPPGVDEVAAWFEAMPFADFDAVCLSAVSLMLADEKDDSGFISVRSVNVLWRATQERYRAELGIARRAKRTKQSGETHYAAKANEWQARIIRRIEKRPGRAFGNKAIGKLFGVSDMVVYQIRKGNRWKHLDRRAA